MDNGSDVDAEVVERDDAWCDFAAAADNEVDGGVDLVAGMEVVDDDDVMTAEVDDTLD